MPDSWEFLVRAVGQIQKLPPGWLVECETDRGIVAVWGRSSNQTNIEKVCKATTPFRITSNTHRTPNRNFPRHAYWIPESALLEISNPQPTSGGGNREEVESPRSLPGSRESATAFAPVLYVVGCTKTKIWARDRSAPRFVSAVHAYRGRSMLAWLQRPEYLIGQPWLILSAKYGFIEPDHPIANYDVTFSIPDTGPISDETLIAQVMYQTRFAGVVPLRSYRRVWVWATSGVYLEKTRLAFGRAGATVESLA